MTEDELFERYGLHPAGAHLEDVRAVLTAELRRGPDADTELMKLCCIQLFHHGALDDVVLIWRAKESSWDAHCSIDVQLLCGAGLEQTIAFLHTQPAEEARQALDYLKSCQGHGDFAEFSVASQSAFYHQYYDC